MEGDHPILISIAIQIFFIYDRSLVPTHRSRQGIGVTVDIDRTSCSIEIHSGPGRLSHNWILGIRYLRRTGQRVLIGSGTPQIFEKIFRDKEKYRERIRMLAKDPEKYREGIAFTPDERYPELSREEIILHLIMAISI